MTVVEEKENPFFKRKEQIVLLKHEATSTPSKAEVTKQLAAANNVDESQIVIDYIFTKSGISESMTKVKILKEKPPVKEEPKKEGEKKDETQANQSA